MATVIIAVLPHASHYLPTLKIASDLTARGHHVLYIGNEESQRSLVEQHGFAFERIPLADFGAMPPSWPDAIPLAGPLLKGRRYLRQLLRDLAGPAIPALLARLQPDLVLIESSLTLFALALRAHGAAILSLSPFPQTAPGPHSPPLDCGLIPNADNSREIEAEWQRYFAARRRTQRRYAWLGLSQDAAARSLATALHLDYDQTVDARRYHFHVLRGPELSLCPKEFDFPNAGRDNWFTTGPSVFPHRTEPPLDLAFLDPARPVVYCSMGTIFNGAQTSVHLIRLLESFTPRTDLQVIASVGSDAFKEARSKLPAHIHVFPSVPQLQTLARASIFITHAGYGSVREAILHGVPMLAVPLAADHHGIAARIVCHGLGLRMPLSDAHGPALLHSIDQLLADPQIRDNCRRMQHVFTTAETENSAALVLERLFQLRRGELAPA